MKLKYLKCECCGDSLNQTFAKASARGYKWAVELRWEGGDIAHVKCAECSRREQITGRVFNPILGRGPE